MPLIAVGGKVFESAVPESAVGFVQSVHGCVVLLAECQPPADAAARCWRLASVGKVVESHLQGRPRG